MLSLEGLIAHHARYRGDLPAITFEGETITWRSFAERVNRVGNLLLARGIRPGDRVATVLANCRELLEIYWAVPTIGAVLVPLSPLLNAPGLSSLLRDCGARAVFTQRSMLREFEALGDALGEDLRSRRFLVDGESPGLRRLCRGRVRRPGRCAGHTRPAGSALQHHVHERHDGRPQGHPAHALHPRHVRAHDGAGLAHDPGVGGDARGRHRLQRRVRDPDAGLLPRRALRAPEGLRPRGRDRDDRAGEGHPHDARAGADHRDPRLARLRSRQARLASR